MSNKAGKIALGLGLLTGAISGILFAPEEGKKIRKKLSQGDTKGLVKDMAAMGEEIVDMIVGIAKNPSVVDAVDKAKDKAADVANMKREELDSLLHKATHKAEMFKNAVTKYVHEQKGMLDAKMAKKSHKKPAKKTTAKKKK
ncbi:YtxH domain-containing protein [Candidatus Peregrinibacteria bacterium]|nr:YtxH domain-containing protein [Candidatus Peregrinibacteria bacterium]